MKATGRGLFPAGEGSLSIGVWLKIVSNRAGCTLGFLLEDHPGGERTRKPLEHTYTCEKGTVVWDRFWVGPTYWLSGGYLRIVVSIDGGFA